MKKWKKVSKSNFILFFVFIFFLTKNYEKQKTELKEETEEASQVSFLTSIPTYAANTAMHYDPFLVPLDSEDEEEEDEGLFTSNNKTSNTHLVC